ncbi:hypothetical protein G6F57_019849 [Rhizopus arrhizus]|nr:hypothetical protein G6F57_019849 [Rhizopus arrhizus]
MHAQLLQDVVGVGQHVHQVRDGRTLVARHIAHAGLQQAFRHGKDALAAKLFAFADAQLLDFLFERPFSHLELLRGPDCRSSSLAAVQHRHATNTSSEKYFRSQRFSCQQKR